MERPKTMLTYMSNIINGPKQGKKNDLEIVKFWVFDYSRENFYYERVLFIINPMTPHV